MESRKAAHVQEAISINRRGEGRGGGVSGGRFDLGEVEDIILMTAKEEGKKCMSCLFFLSVLL